MKVNKIIKKIVFFLPNYIIDIMLFEFYSFLGRSFASKLKLNDSNPNYINLGSGNINPENFINVDFFYTKSKGYKADLRFPLMIDSNSIDGIICEHTLEHLKYEHVNQLLGECHRILKAGSSIRIILPDVSLFLNNYGTKNQEWFDKWEEIAFKKSKDPIRSKRQIVSPMQALSFVTQEYGHVSAWDPETLEYYLKKNGFKNIALKKFREGKNPDLLIDTDIELRKYVSLYMEAEKN